MRGEHSQSEKRGGCPSCVIRVGRRGQDPRTIKSGATLDEEQPKVREGRKSRRGAAQRSGVACEESTLKVKPSTARKSRKSEKAEKSCKCATERGGGTGDGDGRKKTKQLEGAGDVCAREFMATL
eukprot:6191605-Pleurochrysis_carterae.AAC.1